MANELKRLLNQHLQKHDLTTGEAVRLLKKKGYHISRDSLNNWVHGETKRVQDWFSLLALAMLLNLTELEANQLLRASKHPPIDTLKSTLNETALDYKQRKKLLYHWPFPTQTPKDLPFFVGRQTEIEMIETQLAQARETLAPITIGIQGMGGVGKSSLAAHIVHRNRHHYPDGILWANLERARSEAGQGSASQESTYLMAVLSNFAQAYGQDVSKYTTLSERHAAVSRLLQAKQLLVVFDDVQQDQVLAELLPLGEQTAVIITTRNKKLWSIRHDPVIELGPFKNEPAESLQLAAHLLGDAVAKQDKVPLKEIFDTVGHLPLAVDIIVNRLAKEVAWPITRFCAHLRQEKRRLDKLQFNQAGIRMSFNVSYQELSPLEQAFFNNLSVFRGEDFSVAAAADIAAVSETEARDQLSSLYVLSLLQLGRKPERFRLHPLLREFGQEKLKKSPATRRMIAYFIKFVEELSKQAPQEAYPALDFEYGNWEGALVAAWEYDEVSYLVAGANALFHYWEARGLYETACFHLDRAQGVSRRLEDPQALAQILHRRGKLAIRLGECDVAEKTYLEALTIARETNRQELICAVQQSLGALAARTGKMEQARDWTEKALQQARELNDVNREFNLLNNLGGIMADNGKLIEARYCFEDALKKVTHINGQSGSSRHCVLLQNLGRLTSDQGESEAAYDYFNQAWQIAQAAKDQARICGLLDHMGYEDLLNQKYDEALRKFNDGLDIARRINSPLLMARHHSNLGLLKTTDGDPEDAESYFKQALFLFKSVDASWDLCQLYTRWGECKALLSDVEAAEAFFKDALAIAEDNGFLPHKAHAQWGLARLYAAADAADAARFYAEKSKKLFLEMGHRLATAVANWCLAFNRLADRPRQNQDGFVT